MKPSLQLRLGQQITMTPQLQQAIRLLQLATLELQMEIQQALESNIMLEVSESDYEFDSEENPSPYDLDREEDNSRHSSSSSSSIEDERERSSSESEEPFEVS